MVTAIRKGFTLVELLIVITILVILGIFIVLLINPAEILAKSRDSQRISDLATLKGAIQLYLTDGTVSFANCAATPLTLPLGVSGGNEGDNNGRNKIYASLNVQPDALATYKYTTISAANRFKNDGNGWVPLNFTTVTSGAPIEKLPLDPKASTDNADLAAGLYYRFGCYDNGGKFEYEIDAGLESGAWGPKALSTADKGRSDGGNANGAASETASSDTALNDRYEVGNNITILGGPASSAE